MINATISTVGRAGSLDVTVAQIAREAGMSTALAHHYFGSKERMFLAAMRHILTQYRETTSVALKSVRNPRDRLNTIISASFEPTHFEPETIAAWLSFYALALIDPEAARLLKVYHRRLHSNLLTALRPLLGTGAPAIARTLGALIDGVYLRAALSDEYDGPVAERLVRDYLDKILP